MNSTTQSTWVKEDFQAMDLSASICHHALQLELGRGEDEEMTLNARVSDWSLGTEETKKRRSTYVDGGGGDPSSVVEETKIRLSVHVDGDSGDQTPTSSNLIHRLLEDLEEVVASDLGAEDEGGGGRSMGATRSSGPQPPRGRIWSQGARDSGEVATGDLGAEGEGGSGRCLGLPNPVVPNHLETGSGAKDLGTATSDRGHWPKKAATEARVRRGDQCSRAERRPELGAERRSELGANKLSRRTAASEGDGDARGGWIQWPAVVGRRPWRLAVEGRGRQAGWRRKREERVEEGRRRGGS
uniref:DUF834 domain-containing protein n=1 Tax=Oryza punctata TaxID=4537 RepID=A0A0E0MEG9_ORYPU